MNISENLIRIKQGKESIITALQNKGSDISNDTLINEISTYVDKLEIGGGDTPSVPTELVPKYEGASVFRINVPTDNYEFAINLCNNATKTTYDIDWGDGSMESGLTTDEQHHTYSKSGIYDVNIYNISKDITLGGYTSISGSRSVTIYYLFNNTNNDFWSGLYIEKNDNICTDILIGKGITSIGSYAFYNCNSLQNIVLSDSVTSIGSYAFQNCNSLQNIVLSDSVTSIGSSAFRNCSSLQSINIPESVTSIGGSAFTNCSSLQSIVIPDSVTSIGNSVFENCTSLQDIVIPESVTSIGNWVFSDCKSLQSITCPMTAPTIQNSSFSASGFKYTKRYLYVPKDSVGYDSGNWKTYLIDKGWELRYIEDYPKTPTTLKLKTKNNFFHNLQAIGQANLINYELIDNEYIYHFDDKITELIQYTFYNKVLEEIELPEGLEIIGNECFRDYISLQSIVIPEGVTSIGSSAFYDCSSLQSITCPITAPTIKSNTFSSVGSKVPSGTPKILRIPQNSSGYEETTSEWYKQLISKGYKVEYI